MRTGSIWTKQCVIFSQKASNHSWIPNRNEQYTVCTFFACAGQSSFIPSHCSLSFFRLVLLRQFKKSTSRAGLLHTLRTPRHAAAAACKAVAKAQWQYYFRKVAKGGEHLGIRVVTSSESLKNMLEKATLNFKGAFVLKAKHGREVVGVSPWVDCSFNFWL